MNASDRSITTLTALSHALVHTYELSIPIFIMVWLDDFSTTKVTLGTMAMLGYGLFGLGGIPSGIASDKYDSKRLLLTAIGGMSLAFILIGISPNLPLLGVAFCLWGIAASIHHPASLSLISRSVRERGRGFAYHGMAGNFGIAFGPFVTSLLLTFLDWRSVAFILAAPAVLITLFGTQLTIREQPLNESTDESDRELSITSVSDFFNRSLGLLSSVYGLLFLVVILEGLYYRGILTFLPDFFKTLSQIPKLSISGIPLETGRYLYSGMLMLGMIGQYIGGHLSDRYNPRRALTVIFCLLAILAFAFVPVGSYPFPLLVVLSGLVGIVLFSAQPLYQATIAEFTPDESRGLAYGFTFFGIFGVGALGAGISGYVLSRYSAEGLFFLLALLILTGALILLGIDKNGG